MAGTLVELTFSLIRATRWDMLHYLAQGLRRYDAIPARTMVRAYWEFQAVLSGEIARVGPGLPEAKFHSSSLWISPPGSEHGWSKGGRIPVRVAVFHFSAVPDVLRMLGELSGGLRIPLDAADRRRIRALAQQAMRYWQKPSPAMWMCYEHVQLELSLLAVERCGAGMARQPRDASQRVGAAMQYYSARLEQNPSLDEVSVHVSVAPSHLRRLFHDVLGSSPKKVFDQLRFQRAMELLAGGKFSCAQIAEACGFESSSAFSRAFLKRFGERPSAWM